MYDRSPCWRLSDAIHTRKRVYCEETVKELVKPGQEQHLLQDAVMQPSLVHVISAHIQLKRDCPRIHSFTALLAVHWAAAALSLGPSKQGRGGPVRVAAKPPSEA